MFLPTSYERKKEKGRKIIDYMGFESLDQTEKGRKNNNMVAACAIHDEAFL